MQSRLAMLLAMRSATLATGFVSPSTAGPIITAGRTMNRSGSISGSGFELNAGGTMKEFAEKILANPKFPSEWPFSPEDFMRQDESDDTIFYDQPRLVYHIDDYAVNALTEYYSENLQDGDDVLDICSSWVSHYPKDFKGGKVVGLG
jgi:hypothetical protein